MGSCLRRLTAPRLAKDDLLDLIEDTKLNQAVLQGWYADFIEIFPAGVAHEEEFVEVGMKVRNHRCAWKSVFSVDDSIIELYTPVPDCEG